MLVYVGRATVEVPLPLEDPPPSKFKQPPPDCHHVIVSMYVCVLRSSYERIFNEVYAFNARDWVGGQAGVGCGSQLQGQCTRPALRAGGRVGYTGGMDEVFLLREVDKLCTRLALLRPHLEDFGSGPICTVYRRLQAELDTACEKLTKLWVA